MIQNLIAHLSRNPLALKALADMIAPLLRNAIKQESDPEIARLRAEVEALTVVVSRELPQILGTLNARQHEAGTQMADLHERLDELILRQEEREAQLRLELERAARELAELRRAAGQLPAAPDEGRARRWRPW